MPLYQVQTGFYINSSDINQLVQVLQRPSGQQETGKYALVGAAYATNAAMGYLVPSISRGATPVSVSIDTADVAATNCSTPTADLLTANGFRVSTTSTGIATSMSAGGNYTLNF